jgi:hypothetical protein
MDGMFTMPVPPTETASVRRPAGLVLQVALMAAHRDSVATAHGRPAPLEQRHIERIVDGLSAAPVRRTSMPAALHPRR